jgi:hypothetical protein
MLIVSLLNGLTVTRPDQCAGVWMYHTQLTARCDFKRKTVSPFCVLAYGAAVIPGYSYHVMWVLNSIHQQFDSLQAWKPLGRNGLRRFRAARTIRYINFSAKSGKVVTFLKKSDFEETPMDSPPYGK